jgi:hypothetical protein
MGAIISFLGGAAFRLIWGNISDWFTKRQEHRQELDSLTLQGDLDAKAHGRELEKIKLVSELGIKEIGVKAQADMAVVDAKSFGDAAAAATKSTGVFVVDLWNGCIRPAAATVALFLWLTGLIAQNWIMNEWDMQLVGVIMGFYFASRTISTGK